MKKKYVYILVFTTIYKTSVLSFEPCNTAKILQYAYLLCSKQAACQVAAIHNLYYVNQTGQFPPPSVFVILCNTITACILITIVNTALSTGYQQAAWTCGYVVQKPVGIVCKSLWASCG